MIIFQSSSKYYAGVFVCNFNWSTKLSFGKKRTAIFFFRLFVSCLLDDREEKLVFFYAPWDLLEIELRKREPFEFAALCSSSNHHLCNILPDFVFLFEFHVRPFKIRMNRETFPYAPVQISKGLTIFLQSRFWSAQALMTIQQSILVSLSFQFFFWPFWELELFNNNKKSTICFLVCFWKRITWV